MRGYVELLGGATAARDAARNKLIACIGPITAEAADEAGLHVDVVADVFTTDGSARRARSALCTSRLSALGWIYGFLLAALVAAGAYHSKLLTRGGQLAATVVGTITFAYGGYWGTSILLAFFLSSALLSRLGKARKRELVDIGKQGPRDAMQVLANGGVAAAAMLLIPRFGTPDARSIRRRLRCGHRRHMGNRNRDACQEGASFDSHAPSACDRAVGRHHRSRVARATRRLGTDRALCDAKPCRAILAGLRRRRNRLDRRFRFGRDATNAALLSELRARLRNQSSRVRNADRHTPRPALASTTTRSILQPPSSAPW